MINLVVHVAALVLNLCSGEEVKSEQQHFVVKPTSAEVIEGQQVQLFCHVANQGGLVQWSKDGFLLGFDPDIPGYPRHSMMVDAVQGIYNLKIRNIRVEDEGEYQCQVGPATGQPPIRASSKITVQVPPKNVTINAHNEPTTVEVKAGGRVMLTCTAHQSKPAARIRWFRKNIELLAEAAKTIIEKGTSRLFNTHSTITLFPKMDDNGTTYSCEVMHSALPKPIRRFATISILTPPGSPQIAGYRKKDPLQVGDTLTLTCLSRGGNPPAHLVWLRNGVPIDDSYVTTGREVTNGLTFTVQSSDNNAIYRCEAHSPVLEKPLFASVKLSVMYPPERVRITGPTEARKGEIVVLSCSSSPANPAVKLAWLIDGVPVPASEVTSYPVEDGWVVTSTLSTTLSRQDPDLKTFTCFVDGPVKHKAIADSVKLNVLYPPSHPTVIGYREGTAILEGEIQKLTCISKGGNPPPTLHWFKDEKEIRTFSSTTGTSVSSDLVIRVDMTDNSVIYRCQARSPALTESLEVTVALNVLFPPENVTITAHPPVARQYHQVTLICQTSPSNPASVIAWWKNGSLIVDHHDERLEGPFASHVVRSELQLNASHKHDGEIFVCEAKNVLWTKSVHAEFMLTVVYRPEFSTPITEVNIVEGETWKVELNVRANPHITFYRWTKDNVVIPPNSPNVFTPDWNDEAYRVASLDSTLIFRKILRQDAGIYYCEAGNEEGISNATLTVNVLYAATVTSITNSVTVIEGEDAYLECFVDANPLIPGVITWKREGFNFTRARITQDKGRSIFTILNVSKDDAGSYDCVAFNGLGKESSKRTSLWVLFRPIVIWSAMKTRIAVPERASVQLDCVADGSPNVTFVWSFGESLVSSGSYNDTGLEALSKQVGVVRWMSSLYIRRVSKEHYGLYSCVARNELGYDIGKVHLVRRSVPESPSNLQVLNVTNSSVHIRWTPGFDGGLEQMFRIRYKISGATGFKHVDVSIAAQEYWVHGLDSAKEYIFSVSAVNDLGESLPSQEVLRVFTQKTSGAMDLTAADLSNSSSVEVNEQLSWIIGSTVGAVVAAINVCVVGVICQKRCGKSSAMTDKSSYSKSRRESISDDASNRLSRNEDDDMEVKTYLLETTPNIHKGCSVDVLELKTVPVQEIQSHEHCHSTFTGNCRCPGKEVSCEGKFCMPGQSTQNNLADDRPDILKREYSPWKRKQAEGNLEVLEEILSLEESPEGNIVSVELQEEQLLKQLAEEKYDKDDVLCSPSEITSAQWCSPDPRTKIQDNEVSPPSASALLEDFSL